MGMVHHINVFHEIKQDYNSDCSLFTRYLFTSFRIEINWVFCILKARHLFEVYHLQSVYLLHKRVSLDAFIRTVLALGVWHGRYFLGCLSMSSLPLPATAAFSDEPSAPSGNANWDRCGWLWSSFHIMILSRMFTSQKVMGVAVGKSRAKADFITCCWLPGKSWSDDLVRC